MYDQLVAALNDNFSLGVFLVPGNKIIKIFLELFGIWDFSGINRESCCKTGT